MPSYRAAPSFQCHAPSKVFPEAADALKYAGEAARRMHVGYEVWKRHNGRLTLVQRFPAVPR